MIWNAILLAFKQISRNYLRAFLTMLGIIIGVGSVIVMLALGNGTTQMVRSQIASLGSNLLIVFPARGLNTGGMGAFTCLPFITKDDEEYAYKEIMQKTASALVKENRPFLGILYGGLIKTKDGIKVIEFNARFGDPETEVVLDSLESDL